MISNMQQQNYDTNEIALPGGKLEMSDDKVKNSCHDVGAIAGQFVYRNNNNNNTNNMNKEICFDKTKFVRTPPILARSVTSQQSLVVPSSNGFSIYRSNLNDDNRNSSTLIKNYSSLYTKEIRNCGNSVSQLKNGLVAAACKVRRDQEKMTKVLENVFDVHNYSKVNRCDVSTNSSSLEEEEDDENDSVSPEHHIVGDDDNDDKYADLDVERRQTVNLNRTIEIMSQDDEEKECTSPDHHARRPMNAFLIFCKRHRAIVKDKYKHLENRSITKILGDWWATLDAEEKSSYNSLAKEYKDAFFSANPNFKWYKLPAPPLRTLSTRPGNAERPLLVSNFNYAYCNDYETITCGNREAVNSRPQRPQTLSTTYGDSNEYAKPFYDGNGTKTFKINANNVGVFKLADETQMGSLNSLMSPTSDTKACSYLNSSTNDFLPSCEEPIRSALDQKQKALQNALSETRNFLSISIPSGTKVDENRTSEPFKNMRDHANKMEESIPKFINGKRKIGQAETATSPVNGAKRQLLLSDNSFSSSSEEDLLQKKSSRSCKGKKYLEFMNSGQLVSSTKKTKTKGGNTNVAFQFSHNGYSKSFENNSPIAASAQTKHNDSEHLGDFSYEKQKLCPELESASKQFDAADFDLEDKIKALPAQILDDYLSRKRETKKKRKINSKRLVSSTKFVAAIVQNNGNFQQINKIQEEKDVIRKSTAVGSQKRKARKESITRRDINSLQNDQKLLQNILEDNNQESFLPNNDGDGGSVRIIGDIYSSEVLVKQEPLDTLNVQNFHPDVIIKKEIQMNDGTSDLLFLAEIAANHIKGEQNTNQNAISSL